MIMIFLTILVLSIWGKPVVWLVDKLPEIDWHNLMSNIWNKIVLYSKNVGRTATKMILHLYYTLVDCELELLDRILIVAGILYIILPRDLLPKQTLGLLGLLDDVAVTAWIYEKIEGSLTPEIIKKTEDTLDEWFGVEVPIGL